MSAKNFYETFYQTDQLFRLADESWTVSAKQPVEVQEAVESMTEETAELPTKGIDLLSELDALSANLDSSTVETLLVDTIITDPILVAPEPEPVMLITTLEPLVQTVDQPTAPLIVIPTEQIRPQQLNHKVLLLADEELDPSNLLFLEKILKAVNLNIDGVDLLNLNGARDVDFAELVQDKKIHHFITFGVPFNRIHLDIAMDRYHPVRFFGITFLMADSLPTIEADRNLKKRLWSALQSIFPQP